MIWRLRFCATLRTLEIVFVFCFCLYLKYRRPLRHPADCWQWLTYYCWLWLQGGFWLCFLMMDEMKLFVSDSFSLHSLLPVVWCGCFSLFVILFHFYRMELCLFQSHTLHSLKAVMKPHSHSHFHPSRREARSWVLIQDSHQWLAISCPLFVFEFVT